MRASRIAISESSPVKPAHSSLRRRRTVAQRSPPCVLPVAASRVRCLRQRRGGMASSMPCRADCFGSADELAHVSLSARNPGEVSPASFGFDRRSGEMALPAFDGGGRWRLDRRPFRVVAGRLRGRSEWCLNRLEIDIRATGSGRFRTFRVSRRNSLCSWSRLGVHTDNITCRFAGILRERRDSNPRPPA